MHPNIGFTEIIESNVKEENMNLQSLVNSKEVNLGEPYISGD